MFNLSKEIGCRLPRAGWLPALAAFVPLGASADVISLFDEVIQNTVTPPVGVVYPAVTPEEMRASFGQDTATVHVAIFDSVVSITGGYWPYATEPTSPTAGASVNAAAASAACTALRGLFPNRAPQYEPTCASYLAALPDGIAKARGIAIGNEVALGTLALRANDGRMNPAVYVAGSDPGDFRGVNPVNVFLPFVRPFAMTSASQFRADGPPDLTSYTYAADLNEVKAYGGAVSALRTPEQLDLAKFATDAPPRYTPRNIRKFLSDRRSVLENSRLMALMWVTVADATEACFDSKYFFNRWRPQSAIPLADTDGNDATVADATWTPVVPTPNHPEYPAAHSCTTSAIASVLEKYFGTSRIDFSLDSAVPGLTMPVREYHDTDDMVRDLSVARIYGGMHYRTSTKDGVLLGKRVANWVAGNFFKKRKVRHWQD